MANNVDPDQTAPKGGSGSALFAYAILSAILVYEILGHLPYFLTFFPDKQTFSVMIYANKVSTIFILNIQTPSCYAYPKT